MDEDKENKSLDESLESVDLNEPQDSPADALSRTPDDLEEERVEKQATGEIAEASVSTEKKPSRLKKLFRRINIYLLSFALVFIIAGAYGTVTYLNSKKQPTEPTLGTQTLSEDALKQLANTDASVGNTSQTLTIQGNAVIAGQSLLRGNLNVAGNIQAGGSIQAPNITISGTSNLGTAQIQSLQVATNAAIQGTTTTRDLAVSGVSSFSGPLTASQITVTNLVLSGNASLEVPNHIRFTGPSPGRTINVGALGTGGSASVEGSDTAGTVNINTGNNPAPGCFTRISFQQAFTRQPRVLATPIGAAAGNLEHYIERDARGFSICTRNAAQANQSFAFDFFVTG